MFLLFINYVKARLIVDASCSCLHVAAAASGRFWPGKNIGDTSLYLWASIPLGGTVVHSDRVQLLLVAEVMFWGDSVVVFRKNCKTPHIKKSYFVMSHEYSLLLHVVLYFIFSRIFWS